MSDRRLDPADNLAADHAAGGSMRHDLLRANTAVAMVLVAVLALSVMAVFAGLGAARNLERAQAAEAVSRAQLHRAYIEEARAIRVSSAAGCRAAAMSVISKAVDIRPSPELRTEAIACLAMSDLVQEGPLIPSPTGLPQVEMDSRLRYFAYGDDQGNVLVRSLCDGLNSFQLSAAELGSRTRRPADIISFSPDGLMLAAKFRSGALVVWELATHQIVFSNGIAEPGTPLAPPLSGLAFSTDSQRLIFGDLEAAGRISMFDLGTRQRTTSAVEVSGKTFRLRPDEKQVAVVSDAQVEILDYPDATKEQTLLHPASVGIMEWSPDGKRLAVACDDGDVYLWDPEHNVQRHFTGHSERSVRLKFSPDGTLLFSSSRDGTTRLWDVVLGRMIAVGQGMGHIFTPDGERIGFWRPWQGFGAWRISTSRFYAIHQCDKNEGPLLSVDLSPSGRWCVVTQSKGFRVWDLAAGDRETYVAGAVSGVRVAMDENSLLVCRTNGLESWPVATNAAGALQFSPAAAKKISLPEGLGARAVTLSLDGHWGLVELADRRLVKMDLIGNQPPVVLRGRWHTVNFKGAASPTGAGRFAISPDGRWVVTGFDFEGGGPKVWDGQSGALVTALPADTSLVGFTADGRWLGLAGMNENSIWSVGDWRLQRRFTRDEASLIHGALAFAGNDNLLAVSRTRQVVQLRDWQADQEICDLISPLAQSVNSVRMSLDGSTLVMATANDMLEVWRLGQLRQALAGMALDWGAPPAPEIVRPPSGWFGSGNWRIIALTSLGGFALVTFLALLTLRRHRRAIELFVQAQAQAAQRNRELDLAKVELMHSQKMQALGTLAAGIAHDFNNLLSVVRMSNKLIGRRAPNDPEILENVADIEEAVLQGKSVVGSMLGYARTDHENGELTDVGAVVEDAISLLSREFLSGLELTLELERDLPKVGVPRSSLNQILLNLLVNASEAMQGQGRLKIILRARDSLPSSLYVLRPRAAPQCLELGVVDSGPGIAPEIRNRLFEPFFTTKRGGAKVGTGLGLSLVYSIAQQAGLGLGVESEPGQGAKFTLLIPVEAPPVRETHSAKTPNPD